MKKFALAAIPVLLLAFQPVEAKISGSASLTISNVWLNDLDPDDLIDPFYTYIGVQGLSACAVWYCSQKESSSVNQDSLSYQRGAGQASAKIEGESLIGARLSAWGEATYGDNFNASAVIGDTEVRWAYSANIVLPANTGIGISALAAAIMVGEGNINMDYEFYEGGRSEAYIILREVRGDDIINVSWDGVSAGTDDGLWDPFSYSNEKMVGVHYENFTDSEVILMLTAYSSVYGMSGVPLPVPEPSTYALMLAGLGAVAGAARARRRASC